MNKTYQSREKRDGESVVVGGNLQEPVRVVMLADGTIGGMQKAAVHYAVALAKSGFEVVFVVNAEGPWTRFCNAQGVPVRIVPANSPALASTLLSLKPHVIHQHVSGYDPHGYQYKAYAELRRQWSFRVIESNVFGCLDDYQSNDWVAYRFFKSMTSLIGANRRSGQPLSPESLVGQSVLYNPVIIPPPLPESERQTFRRELGLDDSHTLVVRVGRPDARKWADWECRAFQKAYPQRNGLRLLLLEPPAHLKTRIDQGAYGPGITGLPMTEDFEWLTRLYQSADIMLHAAYFGESFGYTLAEGMAAGLPIITRTTPYGDNAQTELVENSITGWVCLSIPEMARRLVDLAGDSARRRQMGEAGCARIEKLAGAERGLAILRAVLEVVVQGRVAPLLEEQQRVILQFARDNEKRQRLCSEPWNDHVVDFLVARGYGLYREARGVCRRIRERNL